MDQINLTRKPPNGQESMVGGLIASAVVFLLVCVVVVALRFYVRLRVIRDFGNDDIALAATLVITPSF